MMRGEEKDNNFDIFCMTFRERDNYNYEDKNGLVFVQTYKNESCELLSNKLFHFDDFEKANL